MKKSLWHFVICVIVLTIGSGSAVGVLAQEPLTTELSTTELTFSEAVGLMNENNIALKIAAINLDIAELDYERALASNLMTDSQYSKMQAEYNLERAKNSYRSSKQNNYLEIFRAYTDTLAAERSLRIRELELSVAEHDYEVVKEKVRIGDAGRLDDLREMNTLEASRLSEQTAHQTLAEKQRVLKRLVGLTSDDDLQLFADFSLPELDLTLDESIAIGLENSFELWDQEYSLELQDMELRTSRIDGTAPIDIKRSELNAEISKLNYDQARENVVENITSSYHALGESLARYTSAVRDFEIAQESYEIYKRQAEVGLITEMQLLQQEILLLNSESNLADALVSYIVSHIQFQHLLGLDGDL